MNEYLQKMELNIKIAHVRAFFLSLFFFMPIWYIFETQFVSPDQLSLIYAVTHLVIIFLELPTGAFADLVGRKKSVAIGLFLNGLAWIYISQSKDSGWLWRGYFLTAIGDALVSGADVALNFDSLKELKREKEFARFSSKQSIIFRAGMIMATLAGGYIYEMNKPLPYILVGISTVIGSLLTLFFCTEPKIDTERFNLKSYIKQIKVGVKQLTKNEYMKDFSIYYIFLGGITWYFVYFLNQVFATEIGFTIQERSWLFSSIFLIIAFLLYGATHYTSMKRGKVYIALPALMIIGFLPGYWADKSLAIVSIFLVQFASMARFSILGQYSNQEFESKYRATAISALNMAVSVVFAIIAVIGGKIVTNYGSGMMMTLLGILSFLIMLPVTNTIFKSQSRRLEKV